MEEAENISLDKAEKYALSTFDIFQKVVFGLAFYTEEVKGVFTANGEFT